MMRIEKDNITIRSAQAHDAKTLNAWWNDGRVMEHAGFPNGLGQPMEETLRQINENRNSINQRCMIEIDGTPVGELNYKIHSDKAAAFPGWKICETDYQNKGYGTKIILTLFEFLFTDEKINSLGKIERIVWDTTLENTRAQHVYESKIGATKTKVEENAWQDQLGVWRTAVHYEITRKQFYALHFPAVNKQQ
ncbi:MAG TPA: GNAT family N-acetyltransferase [Clostridiales bacterium]|nr:GNAT family N-acetyltransferase [Clostridiales bacterium]